MRPPAVTSGIQLGVTAFFFAVEFEIQDSRAEQCALCPMCFGHAASRRRTARGSSSSAWQKYGCMNLYRDACRLVIRIIRKRKWPFFSASERIRKKHVI